MICDDDQDARILIASTMSALDYNIVEAVDGLDALEKCRIALPDLIILDVMMPRMTGIEFVRRFRAEIPRPFVPVLMLTALDQVENRVEGLREGADDYVAKPFHFRELQARVQALLRTRHLVDQLEQRSEELSQANETLRVTQAQLIQKERELITSRITGTAAHNLGQPLTTILLNLFVLEKYLATPSSDQLEQARDAAATIKVQANSMRSILAKLQSADPDRVQSYIGDVQILDIEKP